MALIKCTECGKEFSDKAAACPNCGCPISEIQKAKETTVSDADKLRKSKEADSAISAAVKRIRKEADDADRTFDFANIDIQMKASEHIDLFGGNAPQRIVEISADAKRACDDLYSTYQTLIQILDATCRPLLADMPSREAVASVADCIKYLNDESEIENNYGLTFNDDNFGNVASAKYVPSMENKMIQKFWEAQMSSCFTLAQILEKYETPEERMARLKAEDEERRKAEEEARKKRAEEERIRKEREVVQQRKKEEACRKAEQRALENAEALKVIAREIQAENDAYNKKREDLESEINKAAKEIESLNEKKSALGFFKNKEKKEIDNQIAGINGRMSKHKETLQQLDMSHNAVIDRLNRKRILTEPKIGDVITFGSDPNAQGNATLRWKVIEVTGDTVVLLSECVVALDSFSYARIWLKDEFYQKAFNHEEKSAMEKIQGEFVRLPTTKQVKNEPYTAVVSDNLRNSIIRKNRADGAKYGHTKAQVQNSINNELERAQQYWIDSGIKDGFAETSHGWIGARAPFGVRAVIRVNVKKLR